MFIKPALTLLLCASAVTAFAQTSKELVGRWELVSLKDDKGQEQDVMARFGTRQVFQVFSPDQKFEGIVGDKRIEGSWAMSGDNKKIMVKAGGLDVDFQVHFFDARYRVITIPGLGVASYTKR